MQFKKEICISIRRREKQSSGKKMQNMRRAVSADGTTNDPTMEALESIMDDIRDLKQTFFYLLCAVIALIVWDMIR